MRAGTTDESVILYVANSTALGRAVATRLEEESPTLSVTVTVGPSRMEEQLEGADCVVSCHALGSTTGLALLERVREVVPELPCVLSPVEESAAIKRRAAEIGVDTYQPLPDTDPDWALFAVQLERLTAVSPSAGTSTPASAGESSIRPDDRSRSFEALLDNLPGMVYRRRLDPDWSMVVASNGALQLTGHPPESFETGEVKLDSLLHPDDRDRVRTEVATAVASGEGFELTYRIRTTDGQKWVRDRGQQVGTVDGDPLLEGYVSDITDQYERKSELALKNRAIDEPTMGVVITDPDQRDNPIVYANDGFEDLTGYDESDVLGRNCRVLQGPDTDRKVVQAMREAIDAEESVEIDVLNYRKNGTRFWNHVQIAPVENDHGDVTHFVGYQRDVTTRIEREQRLRLLHRVLRHNLRNTMNVVLGWTQQLRKQVHGPDRTTATETVIAASEELLEISERARELETLLADEHSLESIPIAEILAPVIDDFRETHEQASISTDLAGESVSPDMEVFVDQRVVHAFRELLTNAIVHNDHPRPRIEIDVVVPDDESAVRIRIRDNGPGLPTQERVVLTEGQETPLQHGTGFGLWLVHWLITLSGGSVTYHANDPRGSVVTVELLQSCGQSFTADRNRCELD